MPTVTVIIPVYKVERYLDACVESVVRQSYADLEILLVDDGSPDRCPALCDAWAEKDPRIKVIHRENGGLSTARNSGIDAAMGEFLLFVDSDDLLEPDAVRRAVDAQRQQDADLVIFNLTYVDEANRPLPQPDLNWCTDEILDEDGVWQRCFALAETRIYYVVAWNKLYRRWFTGKRIDNPNTHGTGCTLSSAIASGLAKGLSLPDAISAAKEYISGALASMMDLGHGSGPLNHAYRI